MAAARAGARRPPDRPGCVPRGAGNRAGAARLNGPRPRFTPDPADLGLPRLFVAVALPEPAAQQVADVVSELQADVDADAPKRRSAVRWVRLDGLHLTLRFLGPTSEERVADVARSVDAAAAGRRPVDIEIGGGGAFPSPSRPRTIWLGLIRGTDELAELARALDHELEAAGWTPQDRPFRAHLTLARADGRREGPAVARRLIERASGLRLPFRADRLVLFESVTGGGPARYVARHEATLGG